MAYGESIETSYGGVPLGMEAFFSIPSTHPSRAKIPFERRADEAHASSHAHPARVAP